MIKIQIKKMRDYCDLYSGRMGTIVGSGPTEFDYENLSQLAQPIIFLNDSVVMSKYTNFDGHFFTMHEHLFLERYENILSKLTVWSQFPKHSFAVCCKKSYIQRPLLEFLINNNLTKDLFDRQKMRDANLLFNFGLSVTGAICLAYYFGCSELKFIGCHNKGVERHDPRINDEKFFSLPQINTVKMVTKVFGYEFTELV